MLNLLLQGNTETVNTIVSVIAMVLVALLSIMIHEIAHGYVALWCGDSTAKMCGRLNLNPAKHFDLVGMLMLVTIGFGWAKPVPINSNNFKKRKLGIFWVSIAGILANLVMSLVFFALLCLFVFWFSELTIISGASKLFMNFLFNFCLYGLLINISLAAFNILPICPLDGYRAIEAFRPECGFCKFMRKYGVFILLGIILISTVLGRFFPFLDIFGMYIGTIQNSILNLLRKTWGSILGVNLF